MLRETIVIWLYSSCRSVRYTINGYHQQHIVVLAEVVSVALELSSEEIEVMSSASLLSDSGIHHLIFNFPIFWLADFYHVILGYDKTTS